MNIIKMPSPNYNQSTESIRAVVLHGTAGSAGSAIAWLRNPQPNNPRARVSANYLITRAGVVYELVDWKAGRRAWANGIIETWDRSLAWLRWCVETGVNPNDVTVSVEHEASDLAMRGGAAMTNQQFNSSIDLTAQILTYAGLKASHETVNGHFQISGSRKASCPGVIFPPAYTEIVWDRFPALKP